MKLLSLIIIVPGLAFANDGAIATLPVKGIDPGTVNKPLTMKFYGGEAGKLMKVLPGAVLAGEKDYGRHVRTLNIQSKNHSILITCSDNKFENQDVPKENLPMCSVNYYNEGSLKQEGDTLEFKPEDICKPENQPVSF